MQVIKKVVTVVSIALFAIGITACKAEDNSQDEGAKIQESIMKSAQDRIPTYQPTNFLTRQAVTKWMERMDTPSKTFYIYIMANNGQKLGYYVGQTRPISACTLLTPSERLVEGDRGGHYGDFPMPAPSLDGVYGSGGCDSYFFFDATTDAYIEIKGLNFFVADQPLDIEAEPINVKSEE